MKNNKKAVTRKNDNVYEMKVVANPKEVGEAREGTFKHQLAVLAKKPIVLASLIEKVAAKPEGQSVKRNPAERKAVASVRVRQALTRFDWLKRA